MEISLSTYIECTPSSDFSSSENDLRKLIDTMSTWPEWKIESLQRKNRNILLKQIIYDEIVISRKR